MKAISRSPIVIREIANQAWVEDLRTRACATSRRVVTL